jgi:magnesium chelatase subunit D
MGGQKLALARAVALAAVRHVYLKRDRVALIAFRQRDACLLLPPTTQTELVQRRLQCLASGGTTPLGAALWLAWRTVRHELGQSLPSHSTLAVISDGRANVASRPGLAHLWGEIEAACRLLARVPHRVLLDTTLPGRDDRSATRLQGLLGAQRIRLGRYTYDEMEFLAPALARRLTDPVSLR